MAQLSFLSPNQQFWSTSEKKARTPTNTLASSFLYLPPKYRGSRHYLIAALDCGSIAPTLIIGHWYGDTNGHRFCCSSIVGPVRAPSAIRIWPSPFPAGKWKYKGQPNLALVFVFILCYSIFVFVMVAFDVLVYLTTSLEIGWDVSEMTYIVSSCA